MTKQKKKHKYRETYVISIWSLLQFSPSKKVYNSNYAGAQCFTIYAKFTNNMFCHVK